MMSISEIAVFPFFVPRYYLCGYLRRQGCILYPSPICRIHGLSIIDSVCRVMCQKMLVERMHEALSKALS